MIALEVVLLTGRYVATSYDDRGTAEWPPHPARLFSALVAAHHDAHHDTPSEVERRVLDGVARLGAPWVHAPEASRRELHTVFVPVNDTSVTNLDDAMLELLASERQTLTEAQSHAAERGEGDKKARSDVTKAERSLEKAEESYAKTVRAALDPVTKISKDGPDNAASLLPEHRGRQPRMFPSVTPQQPRFVFEWPAANLEPDDVKVLDQLARRVVRLGHSSSLVSVRTVERVTNTDLTTHLPAENGDLVLRVPLPDQLERLDEAFEQHRETEPRVLPRAMQAYSVEGVPVRKPTRSVFGEDWLVFRRKEGPQLPSSSVVGLARMFRKAFLSHAGDASPELVTGHSADGGPSKVPHAAFVPLPFVGSDHADGLIKGLALILPRGSAEAARTALYKAVDQWEKNARTDGEDSPALSIHLGDIGSFIVERVEEGSDRAPQALRPANWCRAATRWVTATPIALDRHPGDLRSRDSGVLRISLAMAEETIRTACTHIGLPAPVMVTILPSVSLVGTTKAQHFPAFETSKGPQRALVHAELVFDVKITGPILLGAGRYLGLGLLRPMDDK